MRPDGNLRVWQKNEEPISILEVPYQSLKPLILKAAGRSRNRAEWHRGASSKRERAPLEIDNDLSRITPTIDEEGKGILRVVQFYGEQLQRLLDRVRRCRTLFDIVEHKWRMAVDPLHERLRRRTKYRFCIELQGAHAGAGGESSIRLVPT